MPEIKEIKKFNDYLKSFGSEQKILEDRGEEIEEISPPEAKLSDDLAELLGTEEDAEPLTDTFDEDVESEPPEAGLEQPEEMAELTSEPEDLSDEIIDTFTSPTELTDEPDTSLELPEEIPEVVSEPEDLEIPGELSSMELDSLFTEDQSKEEEDLDILPKDFEDFSPEDISEGIPTDEVLPEFDTMTGEEPELPPEDVAKLDTDKTLPDLPLDIEKLPDIESFADEFSETDLLGEEQPAVAEEAESIDELTEPVTEDKEDFEMPDEFQMPPEDKKLVDEFQMPPEDEKLEDEIPDMPNLDDSFLSTEPSVEPEGISDEGIKEDVSLSPDDELSDLGTGDEDFHIDEFTLPEIGEEFGLKDSEGLKEIPEDLETELPSSFELPTEMPGEKPIIEEEEEFQADEVSLEQQEFSDKEFKAIQNTLSSLPLNLRIAVEELIGEEQISGSNLKNLLDSLIQRRSAKDIASLVSKISGKKISIPKKFEKRTGIEFEEERRTFAYAFRKNIIPLLKIMIPALVFLTIIVIGTIYLIMFPLWANDVYQKGYDLLLENYFTEANEKFVTAFNIVPEQHWMLKSWFYKYAEGFKERKQYDYAREKYQHLLYVYPGDRKGILDWAGLESDIHEYDESNRILVYHILDNEPFDFDALLLKADNYFNWAKKDPDNSEIHLNDALETYERLILNHSDKDEAWLHLLKFTIYTDNYEQTISIKDRFDDDKNAKVDPLIYSELAGYLIDKNELNDVDDVLDRAKEIDEKLPEIHYQYSRYFKEIENKENEEKALYYVIDYLKNYKDEPLSPERKTERLIMEIKSYNRMGEIYVDRGLIEDAEEKYFDVAIEKIEGGQIEKGSGTLNYIEEFGKVYNNKGDLYYYYNLYQKALDPDDLVSFISDDKVSEDFVDYFLDIALDNYLSAEKNNYYNPELDYKIGYIKYSKEDFEEAFMRFYNLRSIYNSNSNFIFSLGNTLYNKRDYYGAQGYYKYLIELLEQKKNEFITIRIAENPEHYYLINNLQIAHNNLGVVYTKLSQLSRDPEKETQAKVHFLRSSQYADEIIRDPETLQRGLTQSYGYLNTQEILKSSPSFEFLFYNILPLNLTQGIWQDYLVIK